MTPESPKDNRKWYQKKRYYIAIAFFIALILLGSGDNTNQVKPQITPTQTVSSVNETQSNSYQSTQTPTTQNNNSNLSNDNYYTNVNGNTVHSPAYSNTVPIGASARCGDGTYSFSQNRRGTCSHHGGVAEWL
jgi:hypothetical protein